MVKLFKIYKSLSPWKKSDKTKTPMEGTHVVVKFDYGDDNRFFEGILICHDENHPEDQDEWRIMTSETGIDYSHGGIDCSYQNGWNGWKIVMFLKRRCLNIPYGNGVRSPFNVRYLVKNIKVVYPEQNWRSIDDLLKETSKGSQFGPSGVNLWLYYKDGHISDYVNWSGFKSDVEELKKDGVTMWAVKEKPKLPTKG